MASRVKENKTCNSLGHREMGMKYRSSVVWGNNSKKKYFDVAPTQSLSSVQGFLFSKETALKNLHPWG